ncbi:uncharacterized protein NPIL_338611 [Nephila pilipes]|uniref:Uncharacterized protein n=1 Tax=Nephila pilipes TaxID=299642 RepID=A0A8X6URK7_NEPPI|nr:uncharacterized protein NPIL_338611 [Nephila pilipes]
MHAFISRSKKSKTNDGLEHLQLSTRDSNVICFIIGMHFHYFHLNKLFVGCLFAVPSFICGLSAPVWKWLSKKGMNSVLLICIGSVLIFASLVLIGPASFTKLKLTLTYVSTALLLNGLGSGGKLACVIYSATRDLRSMQSLNGSPNPLLIPTMFAFGSLLGYFSGSVIAGFTYFYLGMGKAIYVLFGFEITSAAVAFIFAFRRNYVSPRNIEESEEQRPILETRCLPHRSNYNFKKSDHHNICLKKENYNVLRSLGYSFHHISENALGSIGSELEKVGKAPIEPKVSHSFNHQEKSGSSKFTK